jgi:hypothetical protein
MHACLCNMMDPKLRMCLGDLVLGSDSNEDKDAAAAVAPETGLVTGRR